MRKELEQLVAGLRERGGSWRLGDPPILSTARRTTVELRRLERGAALVRARYVKEEVPDDQLPGRTKLVFTTEWVLVEPS